MMTQIQRDELLAMLDSECESPGDASIRAALATIAEQEAELARLRPEVSLLRQAAWSYMRLDECTDWCTCDTCFAVREWRARFGAKEGR